MARKRIVCVEKYPDKQDRHHHITAVGVGQDSQRATERLLVEEVIRNLKSPFGDRYFVQGSDGTQSEVIVKDCPVCFTRHDIISTTRDKSKKDNLLELRYCSF